MYYDRKQAYCEWFDQAKEENDVSKIKEGLYQFYKQVKESGIPAFKRAVQTFKNWQTEILNSFTFGYSNVFLQGINNKTKVMKRNAYGFRRFDNFKAKILLNLKYKNRGGHVGRYLFENDFTPPFDLEPFFIPIIEEVHMKSKITFNLLSIVYMNNYFILTMLILLVIKSLSNWYPNVVNLNNSYFVIGCILVTFYIVYCTHKISKEIVYSANFSMELGDLKRVYDGELRLLSRYNLYSSLVEENKVRLDIYKTFSPIPIIVFLLGILIKWDFIKLSLYFENILNFKLELNYIIGGAILLLGIWYVISYRKCWVYHKNLLRRYTEVKTAYESLKIKEK